MDAIFGARCPRTAALLALFVSACGLGPPEQEALGPTSYQYDADGRLAVRVDPLGQTTEYRWTPAGKLAELAAGGSRVNFNYDATGNRIRVEEARGETVYLWDDLGRLAEARFPGGHTVTYQWDLWGRLRSLSLNDGYRIERRYDLLGRLTEVEDNRVGRTTYTYRDGEMVRRLPNGVTTRFLYNERDRLISIEHRHADGNLIAALAYQYDEAGRRTAVKEAGSDGTRETRYRYDPLGRLVAASLPDGVSHTYRYDAIGNRIEEQSPEGTVPYRYDADNRLIEAGDIGFFWDAAGNLTGRVQGDRSVTYRYDAQGRMVEADAGGQTLQYGYSGEGLLVERASATERVTYLHDIADGPARVIAEYGSDGRAQAHYLLGPNRLARIDEHGVTYYLEDGQGSVTHLTDATGRVVQRYRYSPFGLPRHDEGPVASHLYTGELWDPDTGLLYLRARWYDPEIGRFVSRDPVLGSVEDPQSFNVYAYVRNDPVNRRDPLGLYPVGDCADGPRAASGLDCANPDKRRTVVPSDRAMPPLPEKFARPVKPALPERPTRAEKPSLPDRARIPEKPEMPPRPDKPAMPERPPRPERPSLPEKPIRPERPSLPDRSSRPERPALPVMPPRPEKPVMPERLSRPPVPVRPEIPLRPTAPSWPSGADIRASSSPATKSPPQIDILVCHSKGCINLRNDADDLDRALTDGKIRIGKVYAFGAESMGQLKDVLQKHGIPLEHYAHPQDPVGALTQFPADRYPNIRSPRSLMAEHVSAWVLTEGYKLRILGGDVFGLKNSVMATVPYHSLDAYYADYFRRREGRLNPNGNYAMITGIWTDARESQATAERFFRNDNAIGINAGTGRTFQDLATAFVDQALKGSSRPVQRLLGVLGKRGTETTAFRAEQRPPRFASPPSTEAGGLVGAKSVGGVLLAQTARLVGNLGAIDGLVFDDKTGRTILVGAKREDAQTALPRVRFDDLAIALHAAFSLDPQPAAVSIDPTPEGLHDDRDCKGFTEAVQTRPGAAMTVSYFGGTEGTHLGAVMFEADRQMKGLSLGWDNLTGTPIKLPVDDYYSLLDLSLSNLPRPSQRMWNRFWLVVPANGIVLRVAPDGRSVAVDRVRIAVKTETMMERSGKLVPADGATDARAEYFATWLTKHYDDVALHVPIFAELKQAAVAVALARWVQAQGIPVDPLWLSFIERTATPTSTPALLAGKTYAERACIYGGVDLAVQPFAAEDDGSASALKDAVLASDPGTAPSWDFDRQGRASTAIVLPTASSAIGGYGTSRTDLVLESVNGPPVSLIRDYHSFNSLPSTFGHGWTFNLPRLHTQYRYTPVQGGGNLSPLRATLMDDLGELKERFDLGQGLAEVKETVFAPEHPSRVRALYLDDDWNARVDWTDGRRWQFDRRGLLVGQKGLLEQVTYHWDKDGRLVGIASTSATGEEQATLAYDDAGRVREIRSDRGHFVHYGYDSNGDLIEVSTSEGRETYAYTDHRLTRVATDGATLWEGGYDPEGRLAWQDQDGQQVAIKVDVANGAIDVTGEDGTARRRYDEDGRLSSIEQNGTTTRYGYDAAGQLLTMETRDAAGIGEKWEIAEDGWRVVATDPRGVSTTYRTDDKGRVTETAVGKLPPVSYRYDDGGRLIEVAADGERSRLSYDDQGRLVFSVLEGVAGGQMKLDYVYDADGKLIEAKGPDGDALRVAGGLGVPVGAGAAFGSQPADAGVSVEVTLAYSPDGRLTEAREETGAVTRYTMGTEGARDGLLETVSLPDGSGLAFEYDDAGRLILITPRQKSDGSRPEVALPTDSGALRETAIPAIHSPRPSAKQPPVASSSDPGAGESNLSSLATIVH